METGVPCPAESQKRLVLAAFANAVVQRMWQSISIAFSTATYGFVINSISSSLEMSVDTGLSTVEWSSDHSAGARLHLFTPSTSFQVSTAAISFLWLGRCPQGKKAKIFLITVRGAQDAMKLHALQRCNQLLQDVSGENYNDLMPRGSARRNPPTRWDELT